MHHNRFVQLNIYHDFYGFETNISANPALTYISCQFGNGMNIFEVHLCCDGGNMTGHDLTSLVAVN